MSEISESEAKDAAGMYDDAFIIKQLQAKLAESESRVGRLEQVIELARPHCRTAYKQAFDGGYEAYEAVLSAQKETPAQSLQHIEAAAVEKYLPPVMQLTTVPVACREPADFMIGFNRCRNEIQRNVRELRQQQIHVQTWDDHNSDHKKCVRWTNTEIKLSQQQTNGSDGDE